MSDKDLMSGIRDYLTSQTGGPPNPPAAPSEPNPNLGDTPAKRSMDAVKGYLEHRRGRGGPIVVNPYKRPD